MKFDIKPGQIICGFDFGSKYNHIVYCMICVDADHPDGFRILHWDFVDFGTNAAMSDISYGIAELLREGFVFFNCDWYMLESQPLRNHRTFCIAHMLQTALFSHHPDHRKQNVRMVKSATKFTILDPANEYLPASPQTTSKSKPLTKKSLASRKYRIRKKWAVQICRALIANQSEESCKKFTSSKKKDDLADAFAYAVAFLKQNHDQDDSQKELRICDYFGFSQEVVEKS